MSAAVAPSPARGLALRGLGDDRARAGGLERYGRWLRGALEARGLLDEAGLSFGLRALAGGEVVRTGDGVTAAWVRACGRSRWRWALRIDAERKAILSARGVVAISPMVAGELARHYGRGDARVVLNPVFAPRAEPEARARGCAVFVGHGFARKGLEAWLQALRALPEVRTWIVGDDARPGRWRALADHLGVARRVAFLGDVEAGPWIAGAALLVHPAQYEPYGNVVAEAVAAGVPALASDGCGAACLLDPGHVWARASGAAGLVDVARRVLAAPAPPVQRPPSAEAHLAELLAAVLA